MGKFKTRRRSYTRKERGGRRRIDGKVVPYVGIHPEPAISGFTSVRGRPRGPKSANTGLVQATKAPMYRKASGSRCHGWQYQTSGVSGENSSTPLGTASRFCRLLSLQRGIIAPSRHHSHHDCLHAFPFFATRSCSLFNFSPRAYTQLVCPPDYVLVACRIQPSQPQYRGIKSHPDAFDQGTAQLSSKGARGSNNTRPRATL